MIRDVSLSCPNMFDAGLVGQKGSSANLLILPRVNFLLVSSCEVTPLTKVPQSSCAASCAPKSKQRVDMRDWHRSTKSCAHNCP